MIVFHKEGFTNVIFLLSYRLGILEVIVIVRRIMIRFFGVFQTYSKYGQIFLYLALGFEPTLNNWRSVGMDKLRFNFTLWDSTDQQSFIFKK